MSRDLSKYYDAHEDDKEPTRGRPKGAIKLDITDEKLKIIEMLSGKGHSIEEIAAALGITKATFIKYKKQFPELEVAMYRGRQIANVTPLNAIYSAACTGENITATLAWLRNQAGWDQKQVIEHQGQIDTSSDAQKEADKLLAELILDVREAARPEPVLIESKKESSDE